MKMAFYVCILIPTIFASLCFADGSFEVSIDYKLDASQSVPVRFFDVLDISTSTGNLVDQDGNFISRCTSSTKISRAAKSKAGYTFDVEFTIVGVCGFHFVDRAGLVKQLSEDLKAFPVTIY